MSIDIDSDAEFTITASKDNVEDILRAISDFAVDNDLEFGVYNCINTVPNGSDKVDIAWGFYSTYSHRTLDEDLTTFLTSLTGKGCTIVGGLTRSDEEENFWGLRMVDNKVRNITGEVVWTVD